MKCDICGREENECKIRKIKSMYLCPKHITQYYRYGKFLNETIYDKNEYVIYDDCAEIILKNKNLKEIGRAKIDIEDVDKCKKYKWHLRKSHNNQYAISSFQNGTNLHLHRLIMNYNGNEDVDHINGNGLDNRKNNLRIVSHAKNMLNRKGIHGIKKVPSGKYQACIGINYKGIYLGTFNTYEEAKEAIQITKEIFNL